MRFGEIAACDLAKLPHLIWQNRHVRFGKIDTCGFKSPRAILIVACDLAELPRANLNRASG
jgi:hypothetical protein